MSISIMGLHHYFGLSIILALLFISTSVRSQSTLALDGLATEFEDYEILNRRPKARWEDDPVLFKEVNYWINACFSACHNQAKRAEDPAIPYIAGQKFYYIQKQLEKFGQSNLDKESSANHHSQVWKRLNILMNKVVRKVDTTLYIYIADIISKMPCDGGSQPSAASNLPTPPESLKQCITCHQKDGQGAAYNIPVIAGQSVVYMRRQLTSILNSAKGVPQNEGQNFRTHPVMGPKLEKLVYMDLFGLAKYFSAQDCRGTASGDPY